MYIGKCSRCGGNVVPPDAWFGTQRGRATCTSCHAVSADEFNKVIPMEPSPAEQAERRKLYQDYIQDAEKAVTTHWRCLNKNTL